MAVADIQTIIQTIIHTNFDINSKNLQIQALHVLSIIIKLWNLAVYKEKNVLEIRKLYTIAP